MLHTYFQYLRFLTRHYYLIPAICLLVLVFAKPALDTRVNNNMEDWFPASSPQLVNKQQFIEDFGNDELIFLLLTFPDSMDKGREAEILDGLASDLKKIGGLDQVLYRNPLNLPAAIGLRSRLNKLERLFFEAERENVEMIYLRPKLLPDFDAYRPLLIDSISQATAPLGKDIRVDLTGSGVVFTRIEELSNRDSAILFSLCFLIVFAILAWRLRNLKQMLIAVGLFFLLFLPAYSLFGWFGISVNLITMVVPLLLVINFFAYILHLFNRKKTRDEAFIREKLPPIFLSGITTMIGFGSLMVSDIQVIFQFGLLTFWGIGIGLIVLLVAVVPILLKILPPNQKEELESRWLNAYLERLNPVKSGWIAFAVFILIIYGGWSASRIEVDTNSVNFLPPSDSIRQSTAYIQESFGSFNTVDFLVENSDQTALKAEDFHLLRKVEKKVEEIDFVNGVVSYNTWRPVLNMASLIDSSRAVEIKKTYLTEDRKRSRLSLRIPLGSVQSMKKDLREIEAEIDKTLEGSGLKLKAVGYLPIYIEHIDLIVSGMTQSLGLAVLCIGLAMILMVGSLGIGLVALIPNTFPVFVLAILMQLSHTPLDIATSIIASVVIGLVVDDTLHIIWNFKRESQKDTFSLKTVMKGILKPSTTTSLMFIAGFLVLIASGIRSLHDFGKLVSLAIFFGWIGDFIVLPALLSLLCKKK